MTSRPIRSCTVTRMSTRRRDSQRVTEKRSPSLQVQHVINEQVCQFATLNKDQSRKVDFLPTIINEAFKEPPTYDELINFPRTKDRNDMCCVMCGLRPGSQCVIPRQNKNVCKDCDKANWQHVKSCQFFKWCKGCKKFLLLNSFSEKIDAAKCDRCRERGRQSYLIKRGKDTVSTGYEIINKKPRSDSISSCGSESTDRSDNFEVQSLKSSAHVNSRNQSMNEMDTKSSQYLSMMEYNSTRNPRKRSVTFLEEISPISLSTQVISYPFGTSEESDLEDDVDIKSSTKSKFSDNQPIISMDLRSHKKCKLDPNDLVHSYEIPIATFSSNSSKCLQQDVPSEGVQQIGISYSNELQNEKNTSILDLKHDEIKECCETNKKLTSSPISTNVDSYSPMLRPRRKLSDDLGAPLTSYFHLNTDKSDHDEQQNIKNTTVNITATDKLEPKLNASHGLQTLLEVARLYHYISDLEDNTVEVQKLKQELAFQTQECLIWKKRALELEKQLLERSEHKQIEIRDQINYKDN